MLLQTVILDVKACTHPGIHEFGNTNDMGCEEGHLVLEALSIRLCTSCRVTYECPALPETGMNTMTHRPNTCIATHDNQEVNFFKSNLLGLQINYGQ